MNYQAVIKEDFVNGEGVRCSLFVSGCSHGCANCFNEEAWDYRSGQKYTGKVEFEILVQLNEPHISGLSILGGDPLMPKNIDTVLTLCHRVKLMYPDKDIWCWSGYTLEEIQSNHAKDILKYVDVLIDGKFVESEKNLDLPYRGSNNQRILKRGIDY